MTPLDRLLTWALRRLWYLAALRFSESDTRVFHVTVLTTRPGTLPNGTRVPPRAAVSVGFGAQHNVGQVWLSREQFDRLRDGIEHVCREQDSQFRVVTGRPAGRETREPRAEVTP